ncbi:hypothetical protein F5883DRAFT_675975 [Diaporthe sp. PMI_573]|nr:hypothetical protein F5883DRAFT_675975 [Diaporthaceae sp. PMI_573]
MFTRTLLCLLFKLSRAPPFGFVDQINLVILMEAFAHDGLAPQLKTLISDIDSNITRNTTRELFAASLRFCDLKLLNLCFQVGADPDPTQLLPVLGNFNKFPPLVALIRNHYTIDRSIHNALPEPRELAKSLLSKGVLVSQEALLFVIGSRYPAVAEDVIRNRPELSVDFVFQDPTRPGRGIGHLPLLSSPYRSKDWVAPLALASAERNQSVQKLSLLRCLLERNAKADLDAMIAAVEALDAPAITLLYRHGAPVNGTNSCGHSPLSVACYQNSLQSNTSTDLTVISILLTLGACPNAPEDSRVLSPLHTVAGFMSKATEAIDLLVTFGANIDNHANQNQLEHAEQWLRGRYVASGSNHWNHRSSRGVPETPLEYAISESNWVTASHLLLLGCNVRGRELLFIDSTLGGYKTGSKEELHSNIRQFLSALLAEAPFLGGTHHSGRLSAFQTAIKTGNAAMVMALLDIGMTPSFADVHFLLNSGHLLSSEVPLLDNSIQVKLMCATRCFDWPSIDATTFRLVVKGACRDVFYYFLNRCPDIYDSKGLCIAIARFIAEDDVPWLQRLYNKEAQYPHMADICSLFSRRNMRNNDGVWENTAIMLAARAGRMDLLKMLTESGDSPVESRGFIPTFLLKSYLDLTNREESGYSTDSEEKFFTEPALCAEVGEWIAYCEMDDPPTWSSAVTAAAMASPEEIAEKEVEHLLSCHYRPDGWTVLIATAQRRLPILERLKGLEYWPDILRHDGRPEWCPTALQIAAFNGHIDILRFLIESGAGADIRDPPPCRPCRYILPSYGDKNVILPRTALQHAIGVGKMDLIQMLVDAGAYVNALAAMDSGATALQIASMKGSVQIVQYLLDKGADPNASAALRHGRTALQGAAEHGHHAVVALLLRYRASMADKDHESYVKALVYAEQNGYQHVANILRGAWPGQGSIEDLYMFCTLMVERESFIEDTTEFQDLEKRLPG